MTEEKKEQGLIEIGKALPWVTFWLFMAITTKGGPLIALTWQDHPPKKWAMIQNQVLVQEFDTKGDCLTKLEYLGARELTTTNFCAERYMP